ncbi:MAG: glycine cleavage system protein R [Pseudomonadota bacterium]|nr:glycine cleavage system protein R [Pseudomonadota bacterium]
MARPTSNENYILIAAIAPQDKSPLMPLTKRIGECGCTLVESRLSAMGTHVSVSLLAMGSWDAVAKLETSTARIERDEGIKVQVHRTFAKPMQTDLLPYVIEVVAADKAGILFQLAEFFSHHGISIESLSSSRFRAMQTGAEMFSAQITIGIPSKTHIARLRDDFLEFCDSLNLDAIMDPMKF